ncbi:NAD-dependent epimerase/dehydratase family protein [Flavobacterium sp.]|uniref:NAD-dependent epimerase/dehydratase family protein n=1 Tax=Flavobacterium sp. TaxID=239 RepID=UPI0026254D3A|nr:NAD-dependent epimerase/dehydratase family protein [Flavobacterium sp.]
MTQNKTILLTGIAGFIGYHTASRLVRDGFRVIGIDNLNDYYSPQLKIDRLAQLGIQYQEGIQRFEKEQIVFYYGDLQDSGLLDEIYRKEDCGGIISLAAQAGVRYSIDNPQAYVDSNITGFLNILELAKKYRPQHVVYASSSSIYGLNAKQPFSETDPCNTPISVYAASKKANESMAEVYAHLYHLKLTGLRFFTVYGPWGRPDMAPMLFAKAAYNNEQIKIFNYGNQSRDFTYIDDIVEGIVRVYSADSLNGSTIFNIGNGHPVNLLAFVETLENASGITIDKQFVEAQPGDVTETYADISKLAKQIDFTPQVGIKEGIQIFNEWYKDYFGNPNK